MNSQIMLFANLLFVATMFVLVLNSVEAADNVRCRESERQALLEFKAGVVADYGVLSSWGNNSIECCNWRGIRCSNRTHHVTLLNLPGYFNDENILLGLRGKIRPSLSELKQLKYLNLSNNEFSGEIPSQLGNLTNLRSLDLGYAGGLYSNLSVENLEWVSRLQLLTHLDLSGLNLSSCNDWLNQIYKISSLTHLHLSFCHLPDQFGPIINTSFPAFNSLVVADLSYNHFISPKSYDWLFNFTTSLVYLNLSHSQITGPFPNLTLFSSLETLSLNDNRLEGTVPEAYFSNLSNLIYLDLSSNSLSFNFSFDWLPPFQLDILSLKNCTLGPHFPNWITSQRNISELDISQARISDTIPLQFWDLWPRLRTLNMSNNQIKGILPNISLVFPDMEWIDLSYNLLQGSIPPLPGYLRALDLAHNMFTGSLSHICTSPYEKLYNLDLSDNKLSGELSADCFMNTSLSVLNLANNDFSGNIPTSIGTQRELQSLLLRNNNFTGQIPLSLMNITDLLLLDLSENKLNGEVPTWIGTHLTKLKVLSLRMNELFGSIPPQICNLRYAHVLDMSRNNLTGSIPPCVSNFTSLVEKVDEDSRFGFTFTNGYGNLEALYPNALVQWKRVASEYKTTLQYLKLIDLSGNRLVGEIPEEFASLKELLSLNLSSNHLTGNIIAEIGQMANLESLDLSRNHLSGEIPSSLASLTWLSVLDLSNNNITGRIPSSTQLQSFNASDFAGNERLCGPPLPNKCRPISLPSGHDDIDENNAKDDAKFPNFLLYVSVVLGYFIL